MVQGHYNYHWVHEVLRNSGSIVILRLGGDIFLVGKTAATFFGVTDCVTKALFSER
jgi:hypothetical protein